VYRLRVHFKHHVSLSVVKVGYCQVNHREVKRRESRLRSGLGPLRVFSKLCACARSDCDTSAHKKTRSAHNLFPPKLFLHIFHTRRSNFLISMSPSKMFLKNSMRTHSGVTRGVGARWQSKKFEYHLNII